MKIARAPWTSASFVLYAAAFIALSACAGWLGVISAQHSSGAFAGWSVLFWAVAEGIALVWLVQGRRLAAGLAAFVGLSLWVAMVLALFAWWGWTVDEGPPGGFHVENLGPELLVVIAAFAHLRIWKHPLLVLIAAPATVLFVVDFLSSGGNWTTTLVLLLGFVLFFVGLGLDAGESRPYGFWVHATAASMILGAFLDWWHSSDAEWAGIIVVGLVFVLVGAGIRRSFYAVLGVLGLVAATGWYSATSFIEPFTGGDVFGRSGGTPSTWQVPLAYLLLGLFLALLGMLLYGRRATESAEATAA